jgi:hypothetical protein
MFRSATHWTSGADEIRVTAKFSESAATFGWKKRRTEWRGHLPSKGFEKVFSVHAFDMYHDHLEFN